MKLKRTLTGITIAALIIIAILISLRAYYVLIAFVAGTLIIGYRELWHIVKYRKLPLFDERFKNNMSRSVRNGFIFFAAAITFLMVGFTVNQSISIENIHLLGGLLVSGGLVYMLSYLFYERAEPKLSVRNMKLIRIFLLVSGISLVVFIVSVFLHNTVSALLNVEEPVFFIIAVILSPLAFAAGLIGSLAIFIKGMLSK
jgi:hypothetical protein